MSIPEPIPVQINQQRNEEGTANKKVTDIWRNVIQSRNSPKQFYECSSHSVKTTNNGKSKVPALDHQRPEIGSECDGHNAGRKPIQQMEELMAAKGMEKCRSKAVEKQKRQ